MKFQSLDHVAKDVSGQIQRSLPKQNLVTRSLLSLTVYKGT